MLLHCLFPPIEIETVGRLAGFLKNGIWFLIEGPNQLHKGVRICLLLVEGQVQFADFFKSLVCRKQGNLQIKCGGGD
jgi:hypothetical protein